MEEPRQPNIELRAESKKAANLTFGLPRGSVDAGKSQETRLHTSVGAAHRGITVPSDSEIKGFFGASSELPRVERSRCRFCKPPLLRGLLPYAFFPTSPFYLYLTLYTQPADPKNFPLYKGPLGLHRSYQLFSALNARSVIRLLSQLHCSDRSIPRPRSQSFKKEHQQRPADLKLTPPVHVTKQPQTSQRRKPSFVTVFTPKPSCTICCKNR